MSLTKKERSDQLNRWFTPTQPAKQNYVSRGKLDRLIERVFARKGTQILIYGPSGAGKTSMVIDNLGKLEKSYGTTYIRVTMSETTTTESFIANAAQSMGMVREVQRTTSTDINGKANIAMGLVKWLSASAELSSSKSVAKTTEQYAGNDDFNVLKQALFKRNMILVVDDMEKLKDNGLRTRLAEIAKNMSDESINYDDSWAKLVFVGIASTAEDLLNADMSLESRLATLAVPYLDQSESTEILERGWKKAEIENTSSQVTRVAHTAAGIGHVVHELGQNIGYSAVDDNNSDTIKDCYIDEAISDIFEVNSLKYSKLLDEAKTKTSTKTTVRNLVLYAMANSDSQTMTFQDILKSVNELRPNDIKGSNSISPALSQLKSDDYGHILTSDNRNSWAFTDPMFKVYVRGNGKELLKKNRN